jgi:AraC-like DNA-binding protein
MTGKPIRVERRLRFSDWRQARQELIWAYEGTVPLAARANTVGVEHWVMWQMLRGSVRISAGAKDSVQVGAKQWVLIPPSERTHLFSETHGVRSVHFQLEWPGGEPLIHAASPLVFDSLQTASFLASTRRLCAATHGDAARPDRWTGNGLRSASAYLQLQEAFCEWLDLLLQATEKAGCVTGRRSVQDPRFQNARSLLLQWDVSRPFRLKDWARQAGSSKAHLERLFVRHASMRPRQIFEARRQEAVQEALGHSELSIKEIAMNFGFKTLPAFTRWCQGVSGKPPREWRKRLTHSP